MYCCSNLIKLEPILQAYKLANAITYNSINNLDTLQLN